MKVSSGDDDPALDVTAASGDAPAADLATLDASAGPTTAAPADGLPETSAGRYEMGAEVGRGGLGRVLRARDRILQRAVAIKELLGTDDAARRRFVREAMITARLQHPSIVPLYDAGRWRDRAPFYAMKLVAGRPLSDAIAEAKTFDARVALLPVVLAVADAIAYAHNERIIHRDLKPGNVLVGAFGETVVIDWGLAKDLASEDRDALDAGPYREATSAETVAGAILGTPAYMAPEQAAGEEVDERADVYAIGAMLYHVVAGAIPHDGKSVDEVLRRVLAGEIIPLAEREPRTPPDLATMVAKAMARDPARRYRTAGDLAQDLRRYQTGQLVGAHHYTLGQRIRRWVGRHRAVAAVSLAAAVALAVLAFWSVRRIGQERDAAIAEANRAWLAQARSVLDDDPAAALDALARMSTRGPGWESARVVAADARSRSLPVHIFTGVPRGPVELTADGRHAFVQRDEVVWTADLDRGTSATRTLPFDAPLRLCDDGRHAAASDGGRVVVLDVAAGELHVDDAASARGLELMVGCDERSVDIVGAWRDPSFPEPRTLDGNGETVLDASLTDDRRHAIAITETQVLVVDLDGTTHVIPVGGASPSVFSVASSADGSVIAIDSPRPTGWSARSGATSPLGDATVPSPVAVAPDGSWIGVARDGGVDLYQPDTWTRIDRLSALGDIRALERSADGRWLYALGAVTQAWDLHGARAPRQLYGQARVLDVAAAASRIVTLADDGTVRVWEISGAERALPAPAELAALSPDGSWWATAAGTTLFRSGGRAAPVDRVELAAGSVIRELRISDNGHAVMTVAPPPARGTREELAIWSWPPGGSVARLGTHGTGVNQSNGIWLSFTPDGIPVTCDGDSLVEWSSPPRAHGEHHAAITVGAHPAHELVVSADGRWIAASVGEAILVDRASGERHALDEATSGFAFSADGTWLATGSTGESHALLLWDVRSRRARRIPGAGAGHVPAFSPSDRRVALAGRGSLVIVDRETGRVEELGRGDDVASLEFVDDDRLVLTDTTGRVQLWDLAAREARTLAREGAIAVRAVGDGIRIVTRHAIEDVRDDLPRAPGSLARLLRAQRP